MVSILQKQGALFFLGLLLLTLVPHSTHAQLGFETELETARNAFDPETTVLTQIDYTKDVDIDVLLENYITLSDVWSYIYKYRGEGEKIIKDAFLAFKQNADFERWKALWPRSTSLLVIWKENNTDTWSYAGIYAHYYQDYETGNANVDWAFNAWEQMHYNIYVFRDWLLNHFVPIAARAPRGEAAYEQLLSSLETGAKDDQFEIRISWSGGSLKVPIVLVLVVLGVFLKKRK